VLRCMANSSLSEDGAAVPLLWLSGKETEAAVATGMDAGDAVFILLLLEWLDDLRDDADFGGLWGGLHML